MNKYLHRLVFESFLATILVFMVVWLLFMSLSISFKPSNFLAKSLKNVNLTDLYMGQIKAQKVDQDIVIVNIAELSRCDQAKLIRQVGSYDPRVIGIDVSYVKDSSKVAYNDTTCLFQIGTSQLEESVGANPEKTVQALVCDPASERLHPDCLIFDGVSGGDVGLLTSPDRTMTVREFMPYTVLGKDTLLSFAYAVLQKVDPEKVSAMMQYSDHEMMINFTGNRNAFRSIQGSDLLREPVKYGDQLKDKIVLMGFTGSNGYGGRLDDMNDLYFTPMNEKFIGRSLPDMYGVEIHANIISMIKNDQLIHRRGGWLFALVIFLITYLHVLPFIHFFVKQHLWYHVFAKLFQLVSLFIITWMLFWLLEDFRISVNIKYLLIAIFVSVDVLYLYEALAAIVYKKWHRKSVFIHEH